MLVAIVLIWLSWSLIHLVLVWIVAGSSLSLQSVMLDMLLSPISLVMTILLLVFSPLLDRNRRETSKNPGRRTFIPLTRIDWRRL